MPRSAATAPERAPELRLAEEAAIEGIGHVRGVVEFVGVHLEQWNREPRRQRRGGLPLHGRIRGAPADDRQEPPRAQHARPHHGEHGGIHPAGIPQHGAREGAQVGGKFLDGRHGDKGSGTAVRPGYRRTRYLCSMPAPIPLHELTFRATRAGGPGGQHVNTSSTRVELWWDAAGSPSLTAERARAPALGASATGSTRGAGSGWSPRPRGASCRTARRSSSGCSGWWPRPWCRPSAGRRRSRPAPPASAASRQRNGAPPPRRSAVCPPETTNPATAAPARPSPWRSRRR